LPLYRQAQMLASQGIGIDRTTMALWVGYAAAELAPLAERLREILLGSYENRRRRDARGFRRGRLAGPRSRPRVNQDRLPLGDRARRSAVGRARTARHRQYLYAGAQRRCWG
jgi:hypothetical protein